MIKESALLLCPTLGLMSVSVFFFRFDLSFFCSHIRVWTYSTPSKSGVGGDSEMNPIYLKGSGVHLLGGTLFWPIIYCILKRYRYGSQVVVVKLCYLSSAPISPKNNILYWNKIQHTAFYNKRGFEPQPDLYRAIRGYVFSVFLFCNFLYIYIYI